MEAGSYLPTAAADDDDDEVLDCWFPPRPPPLPPRPPPGRVPPRRKQVGMIKQAILPDIRADMARLTKQGTWLISRNRTQTPFKRRCQSGHGVGTGLNGESLRLPACSPEPEDPEDELAAPAAPLPAATADEEELDDESLLLLRSRSSRPPSRPPSRPSRSRPRRDGRRLSAWCHAHNSDTPAQTAEQKGWLWRQWTQHLSVPAGS